MVKSKRSRSLSDSAAAMSSIATSERKEQELTKKIGIQKEEIKSTQNEQAGTLTIEYLGIKIETPDDLLKHAKIDLDIWEIAEVSINNWEVAGKINQGQTVEDLRNASGNVAQQLKWNPARIWKSPLRQIKIRLRRKSDERLAIEALLERLAKLSPVMPRILYPKIQRGARRCLEVSVMDPHFGLQCFPPGADSAWSLEDCERICMWAINSLLSQAAPYGPIEEVIFPFGNDFLHHDGLFHTTTAGTAQPEAVAWHHVYERAELLAIAMVEALKKIAPVKVYEIPGNHDRQSAFTLARVLKAYYRQDQNVSVDASPSPYKFHRYGTNLIGFEHGHSVSSIRLAAIMANERRADWAETTYREWHLGDQHRKGSSVPSAMEEQGVSVEYLPGLTAPNEWHRLKGFNWQKRGAMAWIWDHDTGPIARLQCNLNSYTGQPTGARRSSPKQKGEKCA